LYSGCDAIVENREDFVMQLQQHSIGDRRAPADAEGDPVRPSRTVPTQSFDHGASRRSHVSRRRVIVVRVLLVAGVGLLVAAITGCASLPADYPRPESRAWSSPQDTTLGHAFAPKLAAHRGQSGLRLLFSGADAFAARVALADFAERTLDLQYYMIRDDDSTNALLSRVVTAADRGVRVRLLVDDIYAVGRDFALASLSAHPRIEVRVFNPFMRRGPLGVGRVLELIGDATRLNHRMHNKLFIADNLLGVIGGRNLGNEYFGLDADAGFVDLDLLAVGPVVQEASRSFDQYWASELSVPIAAFVSSAPSRVDTDSALGSLRDVEARLRDSEYAARLRSRDFVDEVRRGRLELVWADARAIWDPPDKRSSSGQRELHIRPQLRPVLERVRTEAFFVSPYFIPGEAGVALLRELCTRGIAVRVLTNSLAGTDVAAVYAGYSKYQAALLTAGVELYELRPVGGTSKQQEAIEDALGASRAALHAKTFVLDRRIVFVGSMNLDPRSDRINTEFGMLIDSTELAQQLLARIAPLVDPRQSYRLSLAGEAVEWTVEDEASVVRSTIAPGTSLWRRLQAGALAVLAPEELL
jgi:putative cardiolipin synthase